MGESAGQLRQGVLRPLLVEHSRHYLDAAARSGLRLDSKILLEAPLALFRSSGRAFDWVAMISIFYGWGRVEDSDEVVLILLYDEVKPAMMVILTEEEDSEGADDGLGAWLLVLVGVED